MLITVWFRGHSKRLPSLKPSLTRTHPVTLSARILRSLAMDPAQKHTPNSKESRLASMERTYADSKARHAKQFDMLLNKFLKLEKMLQEQHPPPTPPKNPPIDITSIWSIPTG